MSVSKLDERRKYDETFKTEVICLVREKEVQAQLSRPVIRPAGATIRYILFLELRQHCEALCKFGDSLATRRQSVAKFAQCLAVLLYYNQ